MAVPMAASLLHTLLPPRRHLHGANLMAPPSPIDARCMRGGRRRRARCADHGDAQRHLGARGGGLPDDNALGAVALPRTGRRPPRRQARQLRLREQQQRGGAQADRLWAIAPRQERRGDLGQGARRHALVYGAGGAPPPAVRQAVRHVEPRRRRLHIARRPASVPLARPRDED